MQCRPCRFDDLDSPPRRALRLFSIANGTVRLVAVASINKMDRNLVYSWIHSQEKRDGRETGIRSEETSFARLLYLRLETRASRRFLLPLSRLKNGIIADYLDFLRHQFFWYSLVIVVSYVENRNAERTSPLYWVISENELIHETRKFGVYNVSLSFCQAIISFSNVEITLFFYDPLSWLCKRDEIKNFILKNRYEKANNFFYIVDIGILRLIEVSSVDLSDFQN